MTMGLDGNGRLWGRLSIIDAGFIALLLLVGTGILLVQSGTHRTSGTQIEGESDILYTVVTANTRTMTPEMIKAGETTHLSIRNQPRGNVAIASATYKPHETSLPLPSGKLVSVVDPSLKYSYDYTVTLRDHALVTPDGFVTNGIKVKVGLPIELEGRNYRIPAVIIDVKTTNAKPAVDPTATPAVEKG